MGAAAAAVQGVLGVVGSVVQGVEGFRASEERTQQLEEEVNQQKLLAAQQANANLDKISNVIATQTVQAESRGISTSSPSFTAIETQSLNNFGTDQRLSDTQSNIRLNALQSQIEASRELGKFSLFAGAVNAVSRAVGAGQAIEGPSLPSGTTPAFGGQPPSVPSIPDVSLLGRGAGQPVASFGQLLDAQNTQFPGASIGEQAFARQNIVTFDLGEGI